MVSVNFEAKRNFCAAQAIVEPEFASHTFPRRDIMHKRDDFDGLSTPQEADAIGPVPFPGFPGEIAQGSYDAASIRWRDGLFVNKNHPAVLSLFFRPCFEQWGNRPSIVGNERQPLRGSLLQTGGVLLS